MTDGPPFKEERNTAGANPKSETPNPKQIPMSEIQNPKRLLGVVFCDSDFDFCFGFRDSDFGFVPSTGVLPRQDWNPSPRFRLQVTRVLLDSRSAATWKPIAISGASRRRQWPLSGITI